MSHKCDVSCTSKVTSILLVTFPSQNDWQVTWIMESTTLIFDLPISELTNIYLHSSERNAKLTFFAFCSRDLLVTAATFNIILNVIGVCEIKKLYNNFHFVDNRYPYDLDPNICCRIKPKCTGEFYCCWWLFLTAYNFMLSNCVDLWYIELLLYYV